MSRRAASLFVIALFSAATSQFLSPAWSASIDLGVWKLDAPTGLKRWLIVRVIPTDGDPDYHVEVLQQALGDPLWKFDRLAPHMAITETALRRSIRGPSKRPENYPESFDAAYRTWSTSTQHEVCDTTVAQCLR